MAEDVATPLLTVPDIQASSSPDVFQGVAATSVGSIFFPDTILSVAVTVAFSHLGQLKEQPIVIDSFPETGFNPAPFQGSASVTLNGEAKLTPLPSGMPATGSAGVQGEVAFSYKYSPAYASVTSGFASAHAFWIFKRTQDRYPVGEIPLKLLVAVPKSNQRRNLSLDFDVAARFSGSWWREGMTIASFTSSVRLP